MNTRTRNLVLASGALVLVVLLVAGRSPSTAERRDVSTSLPVTAATPPTTAFMTATPASVQTPVGPAGREMHTYAVDISWLKGFPPDAAPGDVFDIWVAWDRSVVKGPNMQLLLEGVVLEKIAPPVTPQGPYVAFLFMTRKQSSTFLWGKEYGALSVTQPAV